MGRKTYWMNVSLDLRIERSAGDHVAGEEGGEWLRIDEQLFREFNQRARAVALFVEGRIIYEMMETVWPSAGQDDSLADHLREWARSGRPHRRYWSRAHAPPPATTRASSVADAIAHLAAIRDETDGTIAVGGATLATQLLQHGLLDELLLYTHPAILGSGRPLFDEITEPVECDLLGHTTFENGVALNRYQIRGQRTE